jgi:hypothetical protein
MIALRRYSQFVCCLPTSPTARRPDAPLFMKGLDLNVGHAVDTTRFRTSAGEVAHVAWTASGRRAQSPRFAAGAVVENEDRSILLHCDAIRWTRKRSRRFDIPDELECWAVHPGLTLGWEHPQHEPSCLVPERVDWRAMREVWRRLRITAIAGVSRVCLAQSRERDVDRHAVTEPKLVVVLTARRAEEERCNQSH